MLYFINILNIFFDYSIHLWEFFLSIDFQGLLAGLDNQIAILGLVLNLGKSMISKPQVVLGISRKEAIYAPTIKKYKRG